MSVAEVCFLFDQQDNAEALAQAFLAMARVAHGDGSLAVADAHAFFMAMLAKWGRHEEALLHADTLLQIRWRQAKTKGEGADVFMAEAWWNHGLLEYQVGRHEGAVESLTASRDMFCQLFGEGERTADVDVAMGQVHRAMGNHQEAVAVLRKAVRTRQRINGFANAETRRAAALLDASEMEMVHGRSA